MSTVYSIGMRSMVMVTGDCGLSTFRDLRDAAGASAMTFYASSNTRTYRSTNAASVAAVAASWAARGADVHAYAVIDEGKIRTVRVPVTTARETSARLARAK